MGSVTRRSLWTMRLLSVALALSFTVLYVEAQNVVCGTGTTSKSITIDDGDSFLFKTQKAKKYTKNADCTVDYKLGSSCAKLSFICNKFNTNDKDKKRCSKGDKVAITANGKTRVFCKTKKPRVFSKGDLKVVFTSDAKKHAPGGTCRVKCVEASQTGGTATTVLPSGPCTNCTTEDGTRCQFPFIYGSRTYTSCTTDQDTKLWCSTKVDGGGNHIAGNSNWGYCDTSCSSGHVCQVQDIGFPPECEAQHAKTHKNILFLGNSYTYFNDLPGMVRSLAAAAGVSASVTSKAPGGQTLGGHVSSSLGTITGGDWDVVVMQDQSQRPSFPHGYVYSYIIPEAKTIVDAIRSKNQCTLPVFFLTWGKRDGDSQNCNNGNYFCSFEGIQDRLTESYSTFAYLNQPAKVAPAGEAWRTYANRAAFSQETDLTPRLRVHT